MSTDRSVFWIPGGEIPRPVQEPLEEFRIVAGHPLYAMSNHGRVYSFRKKRLLSIFMQGGNPRCRMDGPLRWVKTLLRDTFRQDGAEHLVDYLLNCSSEFRAACRVPGHENERWKGLRRSPMLHVVSDHGRLYSDFREGLVIGSEIKGENGRRNVRLGDAYVDIGTLVAEEFVLPEDSACIVVDHEDNEPSNNHYTNLRWSTVKQNAWNHTNRRVAQVGYAGVEERTYGWLAITYKGRKKTSRGLYATALEAAVVRAAHVEQERGEYTDKRTKAFINEHRHMLPHIERLDA